MRARNQPSGMGQQADLDAGRSAEPSAVTLAGDWWDARQHGARLPAHALPDDTETVLWTQAMEQRP